MPAEQIVISGAREHNLKNITCALPRGKLIVVTGVSGSGKTSLVYDTIVREAEDRFLSAELLLSRQRGAVRAKPHVDEILGLSFVVSVGRRFLGSRYRTFAHLSGVFELIRLLYLTYGRAHCVNCRHPISAHRRREIFEILRNETRQLTFLAPVGPVNPLTIDEVAARGFTRVVIDGASYGLDDLSTDVYSAGKNCSVFVDCFSPSAVRDPQLIEAISISLELGNGTLEIQSEAGEMWIYSTEFCCKECGSIQNPVHAGMFSFYRPVGQCSSCCGLGYVEREGLAQLCSECGGARVGPEVQTLELGHRSFRTLYTSTVNEALAWVEELIVSDELTDSTGFKAVRRLEQRLRLLVSIRLGYLQLNRGVRTLSTGECARAKMVQALSSQVSGILYAMDEPTAGLHPRDTAALLDVLSALRDLGNTLVVVEHDLGFIRAADYVIDLGPGAGVRGGEILAAGKPEALVGELSETVKWLSSAQNLDSVGANATEIGAIELRGAAKHNLKNIDIRIPLGLVVAVVGVSGSGKSTLLKQTLFPALQSFLKSELNDNRKRELELAELRGVGNLTAVVDSGDFRQSASSRSIVATLLDVLTPIRELFTHLPLAKVRGLSKACFSFNTVEGACELCGGDGGFSVQVDDYPELALGCAQCGGRRYRSSIEDIKFHGYSISQILDLSIEAALEQFRHIPSVSVVLENAREMGLGYLQLGQMQATLSHGELQRVRLAADTGKRRLQPTLYIFDEPTRGLHASDIRYVISTFRRLTAAGHSVICSEHNPLFVAAADYVIELGPGAGEAGGMVVASGTPNELKNNPASVFAPFLGVL